MTDCSYKCFLMWSNHLAAQEKLVWIILLLSSTVANADAIGGMRIRSDEIYRFYKARNAIRMVVILRNCCFGKYSGNGLDDNY